jgi:hypothetical protein
VTCEDFSTIFHQNAKNNNNKNKNETPFVWLLKKCRKTKFHFFPKQNHHSTVHKKQKTKSPLNSTQSKKLIHFGVGI